MARKPDDWMPLQIGPYLADTTHLTRDQHGAYLLLLMAYWRRGGGLPDDDGQLAAMAKATPAEWRRMSAIIRAFFVVRDGLLFQKRADKELAKAVALTEAKSAAGKKGAEKKWQAHGTANGTAMAEPSDSYKQNDAPLPLPLPTSIEVKKELPADAGQPSKATSYPEDFEAFWKAYPTDKNMPKKPAHRQWQRLTPEKRQAAIAAIPGFVRYCDENKSWYRPVYAERFLSQEKFEGYAAEPAPANTLQQLKDARARCVASNLPTNKLDRAIEEAEARAA